MRRYIQIDKDLCIGCNMCVEVCDWFYESSGHYGKTTHRPAFLHCIYCQGECTQSCDQNAIMLVDVSGPHCVLCRDKNTNNFITKNPHKEYKKLWNLLYNELEIIEYDPLETMRRKSIEKIYRTRYDSVIEKLKEFKEVEFVAEGYEFIWFKINL